MNKELRDEILAPYVEQKPGYGLQFYARLPLSVLQRLIDHGFVEMEAWNDCDGVAKMFLPFLKRNPLFNAHGYVIDHERWDSRITVEGVERSADLTKAEILDFANTFKTADEFQIDSDYAYCWYD